MSDLFSSLLIFDDSSVMIDFDLLCLINATFSNISAIPWQPVLVVKEPGVLGENHRRWAKKW
jgi:hypothetical protein